VAVIGLIAYIAISIFIIIMWVRFGFDFVMSLNRGWRPRGIGMVIAEVAFTVTDPPIRLVRRFVPPLKVGGMALDFAWAIVLITAIILSYIAASFL
jgi:YggT family protein